ncbi:MAG: DNA repair protein RecO [bacterium]
MPLYKVTAINLNSRNFGEADKVLTLFTYEKGKIQAIAKGARRVKSKFGARLEIFSHNRYLLASGRTFEIISQAETIESFRGLREKEDSIKLGSYMLWLIHQFAADHHASEDLFRFLLHNLRMLDQGADPAILLRTFEIGLIKHEGFSPVLEECVSCGKKADKLRAKVSFCFDRRGIVCSNCKKTMPKISDISSGAVAWIRQVLDGKYISLKEMQKLDKMDPDVDILNESFLEHQLGKEIKNHRQPSY